MNGEQAPARAEGCVLWLYGQAWEDRSSLDGLYPPTPFDEWVASLQERGWTVSWTVECAIATGPYQGGAVVEVDVGDRAYVAVPPELLPRLREIMPTQDAAMVQEDVAALANPAAHGLHVMWLERTAWEEGRQVVPHGAPMPTEAWVQVIRTRGLRVEMTHDGFLSLESAWPAGHVVTVVDGQQRSYFAVPRGALRLAVDLSVETDAAQAFSDQVPNLH
jgi:hypothetical protein